MRHAKRGDSGHLEPSKAIEEAPTKYAKHKENNLRTRKGEVIPDQPVPAARGKVAELLLPGGTEPDPRFTLANERTFLAWMRTSLALLAGGIAIEAFTSDLFLEPARKGLAVVLLLLGMLLSAGAAVRWLRVERSMRNKVPLPLPLIVPILAGTGALAAAVVVAFILWR